MAIDTLANVKTHLAVSGSGDDTLLEALRKAADAFIEIYCDRDFSGGVFTEDHAGGAAMAFLKNYPVVSVSSVNVDANRSFTPATVLDPSRYVVHADRGVIVSLDGPFLADRANANRFPKSVRVVYTTAPDAAPDAIRRAYAELIGHWYRQAKTQAAAGQQNILTAADGTSYPWQHSGGYRLPAGVKQILDVFRCPL